MLGLEVEMVASSGGSGSVLTLSNIEELRESVYSYDRWLINMGISVDLVYTSIRG